MKALLLAALLPLSACADKPVSLSGGAGGQAKADAPAQPSPVVQLSGKAVAKGSAK